MCYDISVLHGVAPTAVLRLYVYGWLKAKLFNRMTMIEITIIHM